MNKITRFRAYQLGCAGSSFSYSVDNHFTLIEARLTSMNVTGIMAELKALKKGTIDVLHITSWDQDHCNYNELKVILDYLKPSVVEYPGYTPHTDNGVKCKQLISLYGQNVSVREISPAFIKALDHGKEKQYTNILFNPLSESDKSNDNSVVQLFREGRFCLLCLGDCEDPRIARTIINSILAKETDVMILAHHGADNGFTTRELIDAVKPKVAICSSNYDGQFEHPAQHVRDILYYSGTKLFTTKTGDVIIECGVDNNAKVYNLVSNNAALSSVHSFIPKVPIHIPQTF